MAYAEPSAHQLKALDREMVLAIRDDDKHVTLNRGVFSVMLGMMVLVLVICAATLGLVLGVTINDNKSAAAAAAPAPITLNLDTAGGAGGSGGQGSASPGPVSVGPAAASGGGAPGAAMGAPAADPIFADQNPCNGKKPVAGFENHQCVVNGVVTALEQAGANVTRGYVGGLNAGGRVPILNNYAEEGLCPVNVHWHLGAEHLSVGQYDETGTGPGSYGRHRSLLAGADTRLGFRCKLYDPTKEMFTKAYTWKHCVDMKVGETYEIHWPHSAAGMCGTEWQMQTPFYDGVFCKDGVISLNPLNTYMKIGVQAQVFTIVNDERFYYPDLIKGMLVDPGTDMGQDIGKYTGSTTGTSRSNEICSRYAPITWQVDRKCHLISASSFDKMCSDMKAQVDDMSDDLYAHGAREVVSDNLAAAQET